jgi:hypothetical protein
MPRSKANFGSRFIAERYDPTIRIMHEDSEGLSKFIFDVEEPERP